jgi:hypothetical protein
MIYLPSPFTIKSEAGYFLKKNSWNMKHRMNNGVGILELVKKNGWKV